MFLSNFKKIDVLELDMEYNLDLGVWQTEHCIRCGGCCYVAAVHDGIIRKERDIMCENLIINQDANNTSCSLHDTENKPDRCRLYFCGKKDDYHATMGENERLLVARAVLDIFKIKPVPKAEEIRGTLESLCESLVNRRRQ